MNGGLRPVDVGQIRERSDDVPASVSAGTTRCQNGAALDPADLTSVPAVKPAIQFRRPQRLFLLEAQRVPVRVRSKRVIRIFVQARQVDFQIVSFGIFD